MTHTIKATQTTITLNGLALEGYQLPDGSYRMSQTQAAQVIGLKERNARDFLRSKALKTLLGQGYTAAKEAYAQDDLDRQELDYLRQWLRDRGLDPYALPDEA